MKFQKTLSPAPQPLSYSLPGLLPQGTTLYLDQGSRLVTLFHSQGQTPILLCIHQVSVAEFAVLVPLLTAYPDLCSYETLFQAIFPPSHVSCPSQKMLAARPVRRAINSLQPILLTFGLRVFTLRKQGYFLRAAGLTFPSMPLITNDIS